MNRGFTLIEMVIYLALTTLLLSAALGAAYALMESANRDDARAAATEEGNFALQKIAAVLASTSTLSRL